MRFFLMSQGSFSPKSGSSCTDIHADTKVKIEDTLSGFQAFFLQPIIKDRSNTKLL